MMTPGEARGNWIGYVPEPRRWRNKKLAVLLFLLVLVIK